MGINVQVETEAGEVLERHLDPTGVVASLVAADRSVSSTCLRFIDPHGDTTFNQLQLPMLIRELEALATTLNDPEILAVAEDVLRLARSAAGKVHTYLKFVGD